MTNPSVSAPSKISDAAKTALPANDRELRERVCELCKLLYDQGWAGGTGGGMSLREGDFVYMAPSGVQKERLKPDDIFVLNRKAETLKAPTNGLKLSACAPLFFHAYNLRNAGAVLHSHSINAFLATTLYDDVFRVTDMEMIKGIEGMGAFDTLEVPIIRNTAHECDLADDLAEAITKYPKSNAVLVKRHGVYIWGKDWVQAKTQAESYDFLFQAAVRMKQLGQDPTLNRQGR
jgi:methylthioribulose-1-phosphate dehydratase